MSKKNSSVLNLKKSLSKNKKIFQIYSDFKGHLKKSRKKKFIIGVSGGSDSLALAAFSKFYQIEKKVKVFYVLIDHSIRKNSAKEALKIKKFLKKYKISLKILKNRNKIISNVQSKARSIRYDLLLNYCKKKNADCILTAHHSDDQIETFLIRLSRGSGIQGLSSMKTKTKLNKKVTLLRPLLDQKKKDLEYVSKRIFGKFFFDPSNSDTKYLRIRIRNLKKSFEKSGIHHDQIIQTIKNLNSSSETLNAYIQTIFKKNVKKSKSKILINFKKISIETIEIQLKIFSQAIQLFSNTYYPPRAKKVIYIINQFKEKEPKSLTLSKCIFKKLGNYIVITKEVKK